MTISSAFFRISLTSARCALWNGWNLPMKRARFIKRKRIKEVYKVLGVSAIPDWDNFAISATVKYNDSGI